MKLFTVAFFGHRYINNLIETEELLYRYIRQLLSEKEYIEFLVGRNGDFDQCVASAIRKVKKEYRNDNNRLILMLAYPTAEYLNNIENFENYYDAVEISCNASKAHPKAAIQIRNKEMVDRADIVICFLTDVTGGAYKTIKYAEKQNKKIINIAQEIDM